MSLPPILYHFFQTPLPYVRTLALQEQIHAIQLAQRSVNAHKDILLLLEHRPVYTTGRRMLSSDPEVLDEEQRLTRIGADFVTTKRGGQITYHGPGQIVGYPLLDLARTSPTLGIRDYICNLQTTLKKHLEEVHGISSVPSDNTGVFLDEKTKIASIGVQVRHRLTSHGFAINITSEPSKWFEQVVACGLVDVKAGCIADAAQRMGHDPSRITVAGEITALAQRFGAVFGRDVVRLDTDSEGEVGDAIREVEEEAREAGSWPHSPLSES